jgi:tRNA(Glu) U13 pseudouridine synthase TruD
LLVFPKDLTVTEPEPGRLLLEFSLPAGSYATILVRELVRGRLLDSESSREGEA